MTKKNCRQHGIAASGAAVRNYADKEMSIIKMKKNIVLLFLISTYTLYRQNNVTLTKFAKADLLKDVDLSADVCRE